MPEIYKPTFLEKLLGRNYKWWYIATYYFKMEGYYFTTGVFHFLGQSISIYSAVLIWNFTTNSPEIITNLLLGSLFFSFTSSTIYWLVGDSIERGTISKNLILPIPYLKHIFFISTGFLVRIVIYYLIILIPAFLLLSDRLIINFSLVNIFFILIILLIGILIRFLIAFSIGLSAFWTTRIGGQANFYENLVPLILGVIFPYNLISIVWLRQILEVLPWSFLVYHPMQIYLGKYNTVQTISVFVGGLAWCLVLYFLAKIVFKLGLKRNESVGL